MKNVRPTSGSCENSSYSDLLGGDITCFSRLIEIMSDLSLHRFNVDGDDFTVSLRCPAS
jgi:hypothetical protein